jgi:OmpA-OmpF porin, OOP family
VLSEQRAAAVLAHLVSAGVPATRVQSAGFGATKPVTPNDTTENRAKNRRIEFVIIEN